MQTAISATSTGSDPTKQIIGSFPHAPLWYITSGTAPAFSIAVSTPHGIVPPSTLLTSSGS